MLAFTSTDGPLLSRDDQHLTFMVDSVLRTPRLKFINIKTAEINFADCMQWSHRNARHCWPVSARDTFFSVVEQREFYLSATSKREDCIIKSALKFVQVRHLFITPTKGDTYTSRRGVGRLRPSTLASIHPQRNRHPRKQASSEARNFPILDTHVLTIRFQLAPTTKSLVATWKSLSFRTLRAQDHIVRETRGVIMPVERFFIAFFSFTHHRSFRFSAVD